MTNEKAKELSVILKAYSEGKSIQYRIFSHDHEWTDWEDFTDYMVFAEMTTDTCPVQFRIKPVEEYVQFETAKEFLDAQKEHGPYLIPDKSDKYVLPTQINQDGLGYVQEYNQMGWYNVFRFYKWQDGTPCGKLAIAKCETDNDKDI